MPLQNEHRPSGWDEVRGNHTAVSALAAAVRRDDSTRPHVYLMTGPAGLGKTTLARLIRTTLQCDDMNYRVVEPGKGGVEMVRELKRTVRLRPMGNCPVRMWHMEECHRLTAAAQEDLLTILEEPPTHSYFTLATTEPEKLKPTFLRRCHVCALKPLSDAEIELLLAGIWCAEMEGDAPKLLFSTIASNALGSPGIALKLLDEVIDLEPDDMTKAVESAAAELSQSIELARLLCNTKPSWKTVATVLRGLQGEDAEGVRRHMMQYATSKLLNTDDPRAGLVLTELRDHPTYDSGWTGLVGTVYDICCG